MTVWACRSAFCGGMSDAMGSKALFRLTFSTGSASRIAQSKKVVIIVSIMVSTNVWQGGV